VSISHEKSIGRVIEDINLESDLSNVKVIAKANIEEMQIGSFNLEQKDKETKFDIPRWVASILVDKGLVDFLDTGIEIEVLTAVHKEKLLGNLQLSPLRKDFYPKVKLLLNDWKAKLSNNPDLKNEYDKIFISCYDLMNIRISKLISLASLSHPPDDLSNKITPEEQILFDKTRQDIQEWRHSMLSE
tara:strand:+ start:104 stop:664 length:561 start_codon:yes stop_codon:yes gene_type:complete